MCQQPRPSFRDAVANLRREGRSDLQLLSGFLAIGWDRLTKRRGCCGDYGAPGC